jgi:hypothetical protein
VYSLGSVIVTESRNGQFTFATSSSCRDKTQTFLVHNKKGLLLIYLLKIQFELDLPFTMVSTQFVTVEFISKMG